MVKQKFIQFFDINTSPDNFSVLTVKAGGPLVRQRLAPFFSAYKYYKLGRVNVKCVPASTLPVDPTGLSYEEGESTVDPRDQFNPGLVRITNGEEIADYEDWDMNKYYATMLDRRWFKFRLQGGFSRSAVPLVWNVAQNAQQNFPDGRYLDGTRDVINQLYKLPEVPSKANDEHTKYYVRTGWDDLAGSNKNYSLKDKDGNALKVVPDGYSGTSGVRVLSPDGVDTDATDATLYVEVGSSPGPSPTNPNGMDPWPNLPSGMPYMVQNARVRLGWMPTDAGGTAENYYSQHPTLGTIINSHTGYAPIPEVDLMTFILPKAFKTKFYYRVFVETTVYFKDAVVIDPFGSELSPVLPIDRFAHPERLHQTFDYPGDSS